MEIRLKVGNIYKTLGGSKVQIIEFEGIGRKPFIGVQLEVSNPTPIKYFRNGSFSNSSRTKGGHPLDICELIN